MKHLSDAEVAEHVKWVGREVGKLAWALSLHLPGGPTGSRCEIRSEAERMQNILEEAVERLVRYGASK